MNKVVIYMISIIVVLTGIIFGMNIYKLQHVAKEDMATQEQQMVGTIGAVNEEIYDDCTDEWEEINNNQEANTIQVNSEYKSLDEKQYVLKDKNGLITVYIINEDGEEEEYNSTDIATDYLAEDDKQSLLNGIKVYGEESLNQLIEDFE